MNIQIFGKSKCFDTKKAERFFKERGVRFQRIDLPDKGMSKRELESVIRAVGEGSGFCALAAFAPRCAVRHAARNARDAPDTDRPQRAEGNRRRGGGSLEAVDC